MGTTSHCAIFDVKHVNRDNPRYQYWTRDRIWRERRRIQSLKDEHLPHVNLVSYRGLIVMDKQFPPGSESWHLPDKEKFRKDQLNKLFDHMVRSREKLCFLLTGSNDFKCFITKEGEWLEPVKGYKERWKKLKEQQDFQFSAKRIQLIPKMAEEHLKTQVQSYVDIIKEKSQNCRFEIMMHSSILERNWDALGIVDLDLWFSYLNYYLRIYIHKLNREKVLNIEGKVVKFRFVDVSDQYFKAVAIKDLGGIFRPSEVHSGKMTHRNERSMIKLVGIYMSEARKMLADT